MKTNLSKNWMKVAGLTLALTSFAFVANAQTATGTDVLKADGKTNSGTAKPVRVIDNKGTIKYLQVNNGLTQVVNTTNEVTTTTWQLGGTLTDNTYIDVDGKVFALDGIALESGAASADATDASAHGTGTGWTLLVRDEATGAVKKMLFKDLVKGGQTSVALTAATAAADYTYTDATFPVDVNKVSVYRNGAKLLAGTDYTVAGAAGAATVTVKKASGVDPEDYVFMTGDRIEVQWIK